MKLIRTALVLALLAYAPFATAQRSKLNAGYAAKSSGKLDVAIDNFNTGLANPDGLKPKDIAKANVQLAEAYLQLDLPLFQSLAAKYPDRAQKALAALKQAEAADAEKAFVEDIKRLYQNLGGPLYNAGYEAYKAENYPEAVKQLTEAERIFQMEQGEQNTKNLYAVYNLRSYSNLSAKDTTAALNDAVAALKAFKAAPQEEQKPNIPAMYRFAAELYRVYKKEPQKAVELLEEARTQFPDNADIQESLVQAYISLPDKAQVRSKIEQEYNRNPNNEFTMLLYANLIESDQPEKALQIYQEAATLNPNRWETQYNIGVAFYNKAAQLSEQANETKDLKKAQQLRDQQLDYLRKASPFFEKAHELQPERVEILDRLVNIYVYLSDPVKEKTFRDKRKAITGK